MSGDWRERAVRFAKRLANERTSPSGVGAAVCLGIVVGTTPLWGGHTLICVALASVLRLNRVITVAASNYSIPPLAPFVAFGAMQLGRLVMTGEPVPLSLDAFTRIDAMDFALDWLVGGLILGLLIGAPCGVVAAAATRRYRAASG